MPMAQLKLYCLLTNLINYICFRVFLFFYNNNYIFQIKIYKHINKIITLHFYLLFISIVEIQNKVFKYCGSLTRYSRLKTRVVNIGGIPLGGNYPIRIQSMTNIPTLDTKAIVEQVIKITEAGADYVRIATPGIREVNNLAKIKAELRKKGYRTPLIADIHFNPKAAELAAKIVEKVRINPGNYVDKKKFKKIDFSKDEYQLEIEKIQKKLLPLINICKENVTAMRIGVNHGSLSDRILSRYGDTPMGMVESAMEFLRICADEGFFNIILSMKSSNTKVMVLANRLLIKKMLDEEMNYPLHLGVTEAGEGEEGRIKSAVGIGTLLADGIGDTVRISLTENPEFEIPVAKTLVDHFTNRNKHQIIKPISKIAVDPFEYGKRKTRKVKNIGGNNVPVVIADLSYEKNISNSMLQDIGCVFDEKNKKWKFSATGAEYFYLGNSKWEMKNLNNVGIIYNYSTWKESGHDNGNFFPLFTLDEYLKSKQKSSILNFVQIEYTALNNEVIRATCDDETLVFILQTYNLNGVADQRAFFHELINIHCKIPVIIQRSYSENEPEKLRLMSACDTGALFIDGFGDGIWLINKGNINYKDINSTCFGILQAGRVRISKTEYISCPSCGRTLFDLQKTFSAIRKRTSHLKGLKIGIMGCIVNGPGEMADADYGYVGSGPGKITLYKGQHVVKRNIPSENAVDELILFIKENGDWIDEQSACLI